MKIGFAPTIYIRVYMYSVSARPAIDLVLLLLLGLFRCSFHSGYNDADDSAQLIPMLRFGIFAARHVNVAVWCSLLCRSDGASH